MTVLPLLALTAVILPDASHGAAISEVMGPFRIIPRHVESCAKEMQPKTPPTFNLYAFRKRENVDVWYYSGNITIPFSFGDDKGVDINFASWSSNGGWKPNAFRFRYPRVCEGLDLYLPAMTQQAKDAVLGDSNRNCPFPPGTYTAHKNVTTNLEFKTIPLFFYGKYRLTVKLLRWEDQECVACIMGYGDAVPRLKKT